MDDYERQRDPKALAPPAYDGQDLSPTTTRELRGFYAYGLAAEVFAVCGVGMWNSHDVVHGLVVGIDGIVTSTFLSEKMLIYEQDHFSL